MEEVNWFPELSYKLNGLAFEVFKKLGYGYHEKYYQRAYAQELLKSGIAFKREQSLRILYENHIIGRYQVDFCVDKKVVIEWKVGKEFYGKYIKQVLAYLRATQMHLALIFLCTPKGIQVKRIAN